MDAFRRALAGEDWPQVLAHALDQWRRTRAVAWAGWVRWASERALQDFVPPPMGESEKFDASWRATAAADDSLVATGWLAKTAHARLRYLWTQRRSAMGIRVATLRSRGPDPRIADAALDMVERHVLNRRDFGLLLGVHREVADLFAESADSDTRARMEELLAEVDGSYYQRLVEALQGAVDRARDHHPVEDVPAWVSEQLEARQARREAPLIDELLAEVFAHPEDRGAKAVLADAWLAAGEPRGQFIAWQLAGKEGPEVSALLRKHRRRWLGPLSHTLHDVVFEDGFPVRAVVRANRRSLREARWAACLDEPALGTLLELRRGRATIARYRTFLGCPHLCNVRWVDVPTIEDVAVLRNGPERPLTTLGFHRTPSIGLLEALRGSPFEDVHQMAFDEVGWIDPIRLSGWGARLSGLQLRWHVPLEQLQDGFPRLRFVVSRFGDRYTRDDEGWVLTMASRWMHMERYLLQRRIPEMVHQILVHPSFANPEQLSRLRAAWGEDRVAVGVPEPPRAFRLTA